MSHVLEKYYSSFGGVDSRSNKLLQDPKTMRKGSKNFRYNFQDEIQKANGFQHKSDLGGIAEIGCLAEYKFLDPNTGESKAEILGIATDGNLYRKIDSTLSFTSHGVATSVSIIYDEVDSTFKCVLSGLGSVNISETMTLAQLKTALELLAGVSITISGDSSLKAYLLDCVVEDESFADNSVYSWEIVPFPDGSDVPFPNTLANSASAEYEGMSYINLNNCIYITDGQFPMKYDGKAIYRAGVPKSFSDQVQPNAHAPGGRGDGGFQVQALATPLDHTALGAGVYKYLFRFGFTDFNGSTYYGKVDNETGQYSVTLSSPQNPYITVPYFKNGPDFGVFSCELNTNTGWGDGSGPYTINVNSGHNIVAGMCLMIPSVLSAGVTYPLLGTNLFSKFYAALVTGVTSTTITVQTGPGGKPGDGIFSRTPSGTILNAYWAQDSKVATSFTDGPSSNARRYGTFVEIYRSKPDVFDTFYLVGTCPMPRVSSEEFSFYDNVANSALTIHFDGTEADELPRACKYLSQWQKTLIQAGRPMNSSVLAQDDYPSWYNAIESSSTNQIPSFDLNKYTEAHLCDFQSVYWADALAPEGFPQDGLHEFLLETRYSDKVTGIAPNKEALFGFKDKSVCVLTGSLATNDIVLEILEGNVGCSAHGTIQDVMGSLVWLDKRNGFFSCIAGRLPVNIGFPISDYQKINAENLNYNKAIAATFIYQSLYLCTVGEITFVYDFAHNESSIRDCWYIWDRIQAKGIIASANDYLLIHDNLRMWKMKTTNTKYDFTDHTTAIDFHILTAWLSQGMPTVDKHYVAMWLNSIQGDFSLDVEQYGNFLSDMISSLTVNFTAESSSKKFVKIGVKAAVPKLSSISVGLKNNEKNAYVRLQGWELELSNDYDSGEPKR